MLDKLRVTATQIGVAAGILTAVTALGVTAATGAPLGIRLASSAEVAGDVSGPCDEAEHADDPRCANVSPAVGGQADDAPSTTVPDATTSSSTTPGTTSSTVASATSVAPAPQGPAAELRSFDAGGAGTVSYEVDGNTLRLVAATPADGWAVEVEQAGGIEIDLDFRSGTRRVQVDVEFEDGGVRERVRFRDDATGVRTETTDGVPTEARTDDSIPDDSGSDDSGSDDDGDRSGSNSGSDDSDSDDDDDSDSDD